MEAAQTRDRRCQHRPPGAPLCSPTRVSVRVDRAVPSATSVGQAPSRLTRGFAADDAELATTFVLVAAVVIDVRGRLAA